MFGQVGEQFGRLGSQVWSPRYQRQLITVMLEKRYFGHIFSPIWANRTTIALNRKENLTQNLTSSQPSLFSDRLVEDGGFQSAIILPLPFDYSDAGIAMT